METDTTELRSVDQSTSFFGSRPISWWLLGGFFAIWVALLLMTAWRSLHWPIDHDGDVMEYIAWSIRSGAAPYRDIFDLNFPGAYLFYMAGQTFGTGALQFQVLSLTSLGVVLVALSRVLGPFSRVSRSVAMLLVATAYLTGGPSMTLQRDWLVAVLEIVSLAIILGPRHPWWRAVGAGVVAGYAVTIKPQAAVLAVLVPVLMLMDYRARSSNHDSRLRDDLRAIGTRIAVLGLSMLSVVGLVIAWVASTGGLSSMIWIFRNFTPTYSRLNGSGILISHSTADVLISSLRSAFADWWIIVPIVALPFWLVVRRTPQRQVRVWILSVAAVTGLIHVVLGVKNFSYDVWPLLVPVLALVAISFGEIAERIDWRSRRLVITPFTGALVAATVICVVSLWQIRSITKFHVYHWFSHYGVFLLVALPIGAAILALAGQGGRWQRGARAAAPFLLAVAVIVPLVSFSFYPRPQDPGLTGVEHALISRSEPGNRIQFLDTVNGAKLVALDARLRSATRFIGDYYFFIDQGSALTTSLRNKFLQEFEASRPRFVILSNQDWAQRESFAGLNQFRRLVDQLDEHYVVVYADANFRLYQRR
jgi:hypothetical protein